MLNDRIRDLYLNEKLSMREVGERLHLNMWAVRSRMRRLKIPMRSASEADAIRFSRKPLSYNKKVNLSIDENFLHQAALMLYWAEGAKKTKCVDFTNSDEKMVTLFLNALRRIYSVDEKRIRGLLYCYSNQDPEKLMNYWSHLLKLPRAQFIKPYIRENFNEYKKGVLSHGVFHVRYSDKKLFLQIMGEIDIIQKNLNKLRW